MKIIELLAEVKIRLSIGQQWFYELRNAVLIGAGLKVLLDLSLKNAIILTAFILMGFFVVGALDLDWLRLAQKMAELTTSKYNPHLNKISRLVKNRKI